MSNGITVTVAWIIKPELANEFAETLRGMFPETRLHKGFRNIRLLRSDLDPNHFMLIEEWDEAQNFHDYVQFRTDRGEMPGLAAMTVSPPQIRIWALDPLAAAQA
jgi:quinol monooxygenase YgiN